MKADGNAERRETGFVLDPDIRIALEQQLDDGGVASFSRVAQRSHASLGRCVVDPGAGLEKREDSFRMPHLDRFVDGGSAVLGALVGIGAVLNQQAYDFSSPSVGGHVQGRSSR